MSFDAPLTEPDRSLFVRPHELRPPPRLPYVVVRVGCTKCARSGSYRLARLAERYGADIRLTELLNMLSADCKLRGGSKGFVGSHLTCGAIFPDLGKGGPPDAPPATPLRVVAGKRSP